MVVTLRERLMAALPDFSRQLGFDGIDIARHSTGQAGRGTGQTSDPDADRGPSRNPGRQYPHRKGLEQDQTLVRIWAASDRRYPVRSPPGLCRHPGLDLRTADAARADPGPRHGAPELAECCADFSADRGLDSAETKALQWDCYAIRPRIDTRKLWREEKQHPDDDPGQPITRALDPERSDTIVYTEKGSVHCICPAIGEQRDLAFQGFEADRNTLKYRCPAAAYDLECLGQAPCHQWAA